MAVKIQRLNADAYEEWNDFVTSDRHSSVYHTTWWQKIVTSSFGHQLYSLLARNANGNICGILPLFHVQGLFKGRLVSSPLRDRGGVLGTEEACRALAKAARLLAEQLPCRYVLLKQGEPSEALEHEGYLCSDYWITRVIDLPLDWHDLHRKVRWSVNKARKTGLEFEMRSDIIGADRFYNLFLDTRRRLGVPTYSRSFFRQLTQQSNRARFCFATQNGVDLAGIVLLLHAETAISGYAGNSRVGLRSRASDFAYWQAISWCSDHGYLSFDFGADSPHQSGLQEFKKKWNTDVTTVSHYYYTHSKSDKIPIRDSSNGPWRIARKAWSRIPGPMFERFSEWAVKYAD